MKLFMIYNKLYFVGHNTKDVNDMAEFCKGPLLFFPFGTEPKNWKKLSVHYLIDADDNDMKMRTLEVMSRTPDNFCQAHKLIHVVIA